MEGTTGASTPAAFSNCFQKSIEWVASVEAGPWPVGNSSFDECCLTNNNGGVSLPHQTLLINEEPPISKHHRSQDSIPLFLWLYQSIDCRMSPLLHGPTQIKRPWQQFSSCNFLAYANSNRAQRPTSRTNSTPDLRRRALNDMVRTGDTIEPPADNRDREPSPWHPVDLQKSNRRCLLRTHDGSLRGEITS